MFVNVLGDCSVLVRASGDKKDRYPRRCYDIANVAIIGNVVSIAYKRLTWNPDGSFKVRGRTIACRCRMSSKSIACRTRPRAGCSIGDDDEQNKKPLPMSYGPYTITSPDPSSTIPMWHARVRRLMSAALTSSPSGMHAIQTNACYQQGVGAGGRDDLLAACKAAEYAANHVDCISAMQHALPAIRAPSPRPKAVRHEPPTTTPTNVPRESGSAA